MFKRIDHVEIVTDQPERTVAFYTEVLGFKLRARDQVPVPGSGAKLNLAYLELGGTTVELLSYEGVKVAPAPKEEHLGYRMIALEVEDMKAAIEFLATKNVPVVWGPRYREGQYARAEIADPNGYHIELRQWFS
jgi:catechol 2,3-dioxygenase-like lactoylglutathione lyase family enzyme